MCTIKTSGVATATDADGYFELSVPEDTRMLVANFVGFQELSHSVERPGDVQVLVMTPSTELAEVVVTAGGIGTLKNRKSHPEPGEHHRAGTYARRLLQPVRKFRDQPLGRRGL